MTGICTYEGILSIKDFLTQNELDNKDIEIVISVDTKTDINIINKYYHDLLSSNDSKCDDVSEVTINLGNVRFRYKLSGDDKDNRE